MKLKMTKTPMNKTWGCSSKGTIDVYGNKQISTPKIRIMASPKDSQFPQRKMRRRKVREEVCAIIVAKKVT